MTANKRKKMNYTNTGKEGRKTGIKLPEYTSTGTSKEQIDYIFEEANAEPEASTLIDVSFRKKEATEEEEDIPENDLSFEVDPNESFYIAETSRSASKNKTISSPYSYSKSPKSKTQSKIDSPPPAREFTTPSPVERSTLGKYGDRFEDSITIGFDALDLNETPPSHFYENLPRLIAANQKSTPSRSPKISKSPISSNGKVSNTSPRKSPRLEASKSPESSQLRTTNSPSKRLLNKSTLIKKNKQVESEPDIKEKKLKTAKALSINSPKKANSLVKQKDQKPKARFPKPTPTILSQDDEESGVRRSTRTRVQPLKFWENERMVYKFEQTDGGRVPVLKQVITAKESDEPDSKTKPRKRSLRKSDDPDKRTKTDIKSTQFTNIKSLYENISDKKRFIKPPAAMIDDYETDTVVARDIHFSFPTLGFEKDSNNPQTRMTYQEPNFFSTGVISIQAGGGKDMRNSREKLLSFFIIYGKVKATVRENVFVAESGDHFIVPRNNNYSIQNLNKNQECRLYLTICKDPSTDL